MQGSSQRPLDRLAATLSFDEDVRKVRLVSPGRAQALSQLGIESVRDLLDHFPRRYIDLSSVKTIASAAIGQSCTIQGRVHEIKLKRPRPRLSLVELSLVDDTGVLICTVFRQPWLMDSIKAGDSLALAGKVEFSYGFKRMTNPFIEALGDEPIKGKIIPVHPACEKISAAWMRRLITNGLELTRGLLDPLPLELREKYHLMSRGAALEAIHFPTSMDEVKEARRRLAYEELLFLELFLMIEGNRQEPGLHAFEHRVDGPAVTSLMEHLPFELTDDQRQAQGELFQVLAAPTPANHLILGDVGTGKTILAAFGVAAAADSNGQSLFMAPTEVLAQQHFDSLSPLLLASGIRLGLLTGSTPAHERAKLLEDFASGRITGLIGTHALLEDEVRAQNLSLVIIDEQQRFGVEQRARMLAKGALPDAVYLTATPIPRSLALALFGNLSLSYLHEKPRKGSGRTTQVLTKSQKGQAYDAALAALSRGEQVYVVCPLIGLDGKARDAKAARASEDDAEEEEFHPRIAIESEEDLSGEDTVAATKEAELLQSTVFSDYRVGLLYGSLPPDQKHAVMEGFRNGSIDVLVTTTVIEVGVDVPNATVMIIEDADRFGLSQLHQLRGRVGRGEKPGQVFLISASKQEAALKRLAAMQSTDDGFELASYDLSLRREGDILGNRQSGASVLKIVNVIRDGRIIEAAHRDAAEIIECDPYLESMEHKALARELRQVFDEEHSQLAGG